MHRSIILAQQAQKAFHEEKRIDNDSMVEGGIQTQRNCIPPVHLCLSLGPYGASLSPTQEFGGFYPPPYGPQRFSTGGVNLNLFDDEEREERAIDALTTFHLERLLLFAKNSEIWSCIDMIAFETMPLAREAVAIRRTMARLHNEHRDIDLKQWWISFVFPEGRSPQMVDSNGTRLMVSDLVRAAFCPYPLVKDRPEGRRLPVPHGLGTNCTSLEFLPRIVSEMDIALEDIDSGCRPFLVLYPNGGVDIDASLGVWRTNLDAGAKNTWVDEFVGFVQGILNCPDVKWSGIIVGGCCRCGAEEIHRIGKLLK